MRYIPKRILPFVIAAAVGSLALYSGPALPELTGVANFRDIGGYSAANGYKIKRHQIYRSGELSGLTPQDDEALAALHIRYEIDLRTAKERTESPSRLGQNSLKVIDISVGQPDNADITQNMEQRMQSLRTSQDADAFMQRGASELALRGAPDIGKVLRILAAGDEPALIHCTAGKDRTGMTIAVLMSALGVPRQEVYAEYAKSSEAVAQQMERMKAREKSGVHWGLSALPPAVLQTLMGTKPSYMEAAFHAIDAKYGSFEGYEANALKITPSDIQSLRDKLLEQ